MRLRLLISIFLVAMLSGCLPYISAYTKITGEGVTNTGHGCAADFVAPIYGNVVSERVKYSLEVDPGHGDQAALFVMADLEDDLVLPEPAIKIFDARGQLVSEVALDKPVKRVWNNNDGILSGSRLTHYTFRFPQHPRFRRRGSIQLPATEIMGELREGITVDFRPAIKVGILPFNC